MVTYWNKFGESIKIVACGGNCAIRSNSIHFPTCYCSGVWVNSIVRAAGFYISREDAIDQAIRDAYFDLRPWSCGAASYTHRGGVGYLYFGDYRLVEYNYSEQLLRIHCEAIPAEAQELLDVVFDTIGVKISNIEVAAAAFANTPINFPKFNPNNK